MDLSKKERKRQRKEREKKRLLKFINVNAVVFFVFLFLTAGSVINQSILLAFTFGAIYMYVAYFYYIKG